MDGAAVAERGAETEVVPAWPRDPRWYLARISSNRTTAFLDHCRSIGLEVYVPMELVRLRPRSRRSARRWALTTLRPAFPGYALVHPEAVSHSVDLLEAAPGWRRWVMAGRTVVRVRPAAVERLRLLEAEWIADTAAKPRDVLDAGARVRVVDGLFAGLDGTVVRDDGRAKIWIQIDGLDAHCEVPSCTVAPI